MCRHHFSNTFSGGETSLNYACYLQGILRSPDCVSIASNGTFSFNTTSSVINNRNITATNQTFPASGLLSSELDPTGTITAQCTAGDAYKILLCSGGSGTTSARTMLRSCGGGIGEGDGEVAGLWRRERKFLKLPRGFANKVERLLR